MTGYKLTEYQKDLLVGVEYAPNQYFNPIQDINGDWFIFHREYYLCNIEWVKLLVESEYVPPLIELP